MVRAWLGFLSGNAISLAHLIQHCPVSELKRLGSEPIGPKHLDAFAHPVQRDLHVHAYSVCGESLVLVGKLGGDALLLVNPVSVAVDETLDLVGSRRVGEVFEAEHRVVTAGVDGHHGHFGFRHELGPDLRRAARAHIPVGGCSVSNGVDSLFSVLKFKLLLLLGKEARLDPRILDQFAALYEAFEPRLEERLVYPVAGLEIWCHVWVNFSPVAQGDCENLAIVVRTRSNIDPGAAIPDVCTRLAGGCGARPHDGLFGKLLPDVFGRPKSVVLVAVVITLVNRGGGRDRKAHRTANEEGESH